MLVTIRLAICASRLKKGGSQESLALMTELDQNYVGGIERGEHNVGMISLKKICDSLELKLSEILKLAGY